MGREPFTLSTSTSCLSSPSSCLLPARSTLSPPERTLPTRRQPICNRRTSLSSSAVSTSLQSLLVQKLCKVIFVSLVTNVKDWMTFQINYFYITENDFTFAALVILIFLHVPRELHICNSSPSRSEKTCLIEYILSNYVSTSDPSTRKWNLALQTV